VSKLTARGLLHPKYPGVHLIGHTAVSRTGELLAAVLAGGDGALLTNQAAVELRGFQRRQARVIDVLVPRRHDPLPGIRFRQTRSIHWRDVSDVDGVPVVSVPRLCVDLSDVMHPLELTNVLHEAAFWGRLSVPGVQDAMGRANGRHNLDVLERAIAYHLDGSAGFKSGNERHCFRLIEEAGLPEPLVNVRFGGLEIDLRGPEQMLAVEVDGTGHGRPRTLREDAAVELALAAAGYTLLRVTEEELRQDGEGVVRRISQALGRAG
jgi:hypothetical protein